MALSEEQKRKLAEKMAKTENVVNETQQNIQPQPQVIIYQEAPKKKKSKWWIVVVVILAIGILGAYGNNQKKKTEHGDPVKPTSSSSNEKPADVSAEVEETGVVETDDVGVSENDTTNDSNTDDELNYEVTNTIFNVYKNELFDEYRYDALVEIQNNGTKNIYIASDAQFDIEDTEGHLIQTDKILSECPDIILPGEKGYLYCMFGSSMESVTDPNNVTLSPHYTVKTTNKTPHEYPISDTSVKDDTFGKTVVGRLTNDTNDEVSYIYVNVLYYNSEGTCVGVGGTSITNVAPGDTKSFEISGIGATHGYEDDLADYKVIARDYVLFK